MVLETDSENRGNSRVVFETDSETAGIAELCLNARTETIAWDAAKHRKRSTARLGGES